MAEPIPYEKIEGIGKIKYLNENKYPSLIKFYIKSYKDLNTIIKKLVNVGAYIASINYLEPAIEKIEF